MDINNAREGNTLVILYTYTFTLYGNIVGCEN